MQPVPEDSGGFVGHTIFLMDADDWCPTPEDAIEHAYQKQKDEEAECEVRRVGEARP
jgi:hypothetical protein